MTSNEQDGYGPFDRERLVAERPKSAAIPGTGTEYRSDFARDRARVLHCAALRRLADKTQVVGPRESETLRTRLTHSLEVAQIGRGMAIPLGCDPDLVDMAGLAHDIGHPPYGHNGERALNEFAADCGGFEGNAQNFRILTRIEPKVLDAQGNSVGLNLTRAALDAVTKYPWERGARGRKFGFYADDLEAADWVRAGAPSAHPCLESQVMDWADDVAYSVHDVEDALVAGHLDIRALPGAGRASDPEGLLGTASLYADASTDELGEAVDRLTTLPFWPTSYDGSLRSLAALKNLTSQLIGRFCAAAEKATRESHGDGRLTRYAADLVVPREQRLEVAVLKAVANRWVMQREGAESVYSGQREIVQELAAALRLTAPVSLDPVLLAAYDAAPDDDARLRVVVDQVASLTDRSVVAWHQRLCR